MGKLLSQLDGEEVGICGVAHMFTGESGRWYYQVIFYEDGDVQAWRQLKKFALTDNRWCKVRLK